MKKKLLGTCPICDGKLVVSELTCNSCNSTIRGSFQLSKFDSLSMQQQEFALVFIKNAGNIKAIEKELNISYPTVKKNLSDLITSLGFDSVKLDIKEKMSEEEIYRSLKNKEISFDEAENLLKEIKENE